MNVLIGVTGSIAAYKAAEVVSQLRKSGANVSVVMTENATRLIGPATFRSLSGNPVRVGLWEDVPGTPIHIAMAVEQDVVAIVPATANIIGKVANGICDDLLSTIVVSTKAPVIMAPAMNENMYLNPVVQENIHALKKRGFLFVEPETGWLACGVEGMGRLADPSAIVAAIVDAADGGRAGSARAAGSGVNPGAAGRQDLGGRKIIVTGGPTREPIDPVRFISNRSSGKMAVSLAAAARLRGAEAVLISGPLAVNPPAGIRTIKVETAAEMSRAIEGEWEDADCVIMAAAVGDFAPEKIRDRKIKRASSFNLKLVSTEDILAGLGRKKAGRVVVGFALETENEIEAARAKLAQKNLDLIFVNNPGREGCGFGSDMNAGYLIDGNGTVCEVPLASKMEVADRILDGASALLSKTRS